MEDDNVVELPIVTKKQFEHIADVMDKEVQELEEVLIRLKARVQDIKDQIDVWED